MRSSLHTAIANEKPLQCVGVMNAYHARLAEANGFKSLYLSGSGVATGSCGIPDLGITTMEDVLTDLRRITAVNDLPVLVDIDTGWGSAFNIGRAIRAMGGKSTRRGDDMLFDSSASTTSHSAAANSRPAHEST